MTATNIIEPAPTEGVVWCLVMRRFDQSDILDNIAQSGEWSNETIVALARAAEEWSAIDTTDPVSVSASNMADHVVR